MPSNSFRELAEIVRLDRGRHRRPQDGVCAMELVAWMAGEPHSDQPRSVSPRIAAFVRAFNDALDGEQRQRLAPLAARMIDTRGDQDVELLRGQLLWDWTIATAVPRWLAATGRADLGLLLREQRGAGLPAATVALDVFGHADVRPVDDERTNATVTLALAVSGVTGACLAGGDVADELSGARARRPWHAARMLARAAAWHVAEAEPAANLGGVVDELRDSAFALLERLIMVTEPAPPPAPPQVTEISVMRPARPTTAAAVPALL